MVVLRQNWHPLTPLPRDMFYSYVWTQSWLGRSILPLHSKTNLICWDRWGQMVTRLLFLYRFFFPQCLERWQKRSRQLCVLGVVVCLRLIGSLALAAQAPGAGASATECQGRPSACHSQAALDQRICEGKSHTHLNWYHSQGVHTCTYCAKQNRLHAHAFWPEIKFEDRQRTVNLIIRTLRAGPGTKKKGTKCRFEKVKAGDIFANSLWPAIKSLNHVEKEEKLSSWQHWE